MHVYNKHSTCACIFSDTYMDICTCRYRAGLYYGVLDTGVPLGQVTGGGGQIGRGQGS